MLNTLLIKLKQYFKPVEKQKEVTTMAKKKVNFKLTDGIKPKKMDSAGKPFGLKLPFAVTVAPNSIKEIDLGISCELPLLVISNFSDMSESKVKLVAPGERIVVTISTLSGVSLGDGEVVAKAFVVDNSDMELM